MAKAQPKKAPAAKASAGGDDEGKLFAVLAYLLGIIGFLIVILAKKDNKFAMYHAKQSLVLFIASVIIWIVGVIIPFLGWFIILPLGMLAVLVFVVLGIINAVQGAEKPLPLIGQFADKFNI